MNSLEPDRRDYRFPFSINSSLRQAESANYPAHISQMIRQFLLTSPGERVCLPEFGAGLRRLIFAPNSIALQSATKLLIRQGLEKYLGQYIIVKEVEVQDCPEQNDGAIKIDIKYQIIETQTTETLSLEMP